MAQSALPSSSGRFVPVSTHYLESQGDGSETTLPSLLERSEQLADEAREALPYSFDECTFSKGYLRQSVWSCVDCGERGVCYGCSISCHAEHKLVELWTKRHFRCDCPTVSMPESKGKRRKCTLNPPQAQPQPLNEENKYGTTFAGKFCRCGRDYDPEKETEAMLNCIACEDWFHESCLNLIPGTLTKEAEADDEDEERDVLIPSDTYDGLICAACVCIHPLLVQNAGKEGWMVIEPRKDGAMGVIGRPGQTSQPDDNKEDVSKSLASRTDEDLAGAPSCDMDNSGDATATHGDEATAPTSTSAVGSDGRKRPADEKPENATNPKRPKVEDEQEQKRELGDGPLRGKGDVFLAHGVRDKLKNALPSEVIASLPFPLEDEEIYEPPQDADEGEVSDDISYMKPLTAVETLDEVTDRVVSSLPRVQAIEALHGYQLMKDQLKTMLASHAQEGRAVSKEDIEGFFAKLQAKRES